MTRCPKPARQGSTAARLSAAALALALTGAGCMGVVTSNESSSSGSSPGSGAMSGGSGSGSGSGGGNVPDPLGPSPEGPDRSAEACKTVNPGPTLLRRLTRAEYDNTVRDLIGTDLGLAQAFPPEELSHGFNNHAEIRTVSDMLAEHYFAAAKKIGAAVAGKLAEIAPCDVAAMGEDACLDAFLDTFAARAWRRPLTSDERDRLKTRFAEARLSTFADGVDALTQILVLSPSFLYRTEDTIPVDGASYSRLGQYAMASRLSYLLWGTMPDADLFKAAGEDKLGTRDEILSQAKRMLEDPRAGKMVADFGSQWLTLDELELTEKDTDLYPEYTPELKEHYLGESQALVDSIWKEGASLEAFLTTKHTFVDETLAKLYGIGNVSGADFQKASIPGAEHAGVLTLGAVMASRSKVDQSSPIKRGVFVHERFTCFEVPPAPEDLNIEPIVFNPDMTAKERFKVHNESPACAGCHQYIDPIGFGFENFDALGRWRTTEAGKTIDVTGNLTGTDVDAPFNGPAELAALLAKSKKVKSCVADLWFRYSYGRDPTDADTCTVETLRNKLEETGSLKDLLLAITQTDAFLFASNGGI